MVGFGQTGPDRRTDVFAWDTNETFRKWNTKELVRNFAIPMGMHLWLESVIAHLPTASGFEMFIDNESDAREQINTFKQFDNSAGIRTLSAHHFFQGRADTFTMEPRLIGRDVFNSIGFFKASDTDNVALTFTWLILPGPMDWSREWAELLRQKTNIARQTSAGGLYNQVGDYHVLKRYNLV